MAKQNKLAIFDIDGTIFRKNLAFELINELSWLNVFPRKVRDQLVDLYTAWLDHKGTYEAYRLALVELYEKYLKGCNVRDVEHASKMVVAFHRDRTYVFAEQLIEKFRKEEYHIIAISGSPIEIVREFNDKHLHFDAAYGSVYETDECGIYTGNTVFEPTKDKGAVVKQFAFEHKLTMENSYGVGDTESDVKFLELVENPIALNPNENLKKIAQERGWRIVVEKKDVVYEMTQCINLNLV